MRPTSIRGFIGCLLSGLATSLAAAAPSPNTPADSIYNDRITQTDSNWPAI